MSASIFAVSAGLCAASASVFAKLAVDGKANQIFQFICLHSVENVAACQEGPGDQLYAEDLALLSKVMVAVRLFFVIMIFVSNAAMWALFTKSLSLSKSSVHVTVLNSAMNFFFTAFLGFLIFGEPLSPQWYLGSCFIVGGTLLMDRGYKKAQQKQSIRKDH